MNAPVNLTHDRYTVRSYGSRDMAMVYDNQRHVPFAGPCSWNDAVALANHMEAVHKRSRQQIEAEATYDFPEHERSASRWSVGDWHAAAQRRTR